MKHRMNIGIGTLSETMRPAFQIKTNKNLVEEHQKLPAK